MLVTKPDVIDASGSHKSGSKTAIHAMQSIFDADESKSDDQKISLKLRLK